MSLRLRIPGQPLEDRRGLGREYDSEFSHAPSGVDGKDNKVPDWKGAFPGEQEDVIVPMLQVTAAAAGKAQNQISVFFRDVDLAEAGMGIGTSVAFNRKRGLGSPLSLSLQLLIAPVPIRLCPKARPFPSLIIPCRTSPKRRSRLALGQAIAEPQYASRFGTTCIRSGHPVVHQHPPLSESPSVQHQRKD